MQPDLDSRLRHLRLSGMAETLPVRNQEAITNNLAYVDFLDLLVEDELNRRRDRLRISVNPATQIGRIRPASSDVSGHRRSDSDGQVGRLLGVTSF